MSPASDRRSANGHKQQAQELRSDQFSPHSAEAEEAVLGSILISPDALFEVIGFLKPEHFFIVRNAWIYEAMLALHDRRDPIDYLTVVSELEQTSQLAEVGGAAYILSLIHRTPSALNVEGYGRIVERMAMRRGLIDSASAIARAAHSEETDIETVIARARLSLQAATGEYLSSQVVPADEVGEVLLAQKQEEDEAAAAGGHLNLATGLPDFDYVTDYQVRFGRILSILGASGHFKTTLACQLCGFWAGVQDLPVLYISQEMPREDVLDLMARSLAYTQGWTYQQALEHLRASKLHFISGQQTVDSIASATRALTLRYGPIIVVVDTVNKLKEVSGGKNITEDLTRVSGALDALKLESGALVVELVQQYIETNAQSPAVLRASRNNIKYAKALYEDADVFVGLFHADGWRHEFGERFSDPLCPPGHVQLKALKTRKGDKERSVLLRVLPAVPAFKASESEHVDLEEAVWGGTR